MTDCIALFSNKGGVGKTAAAVNLAYLAAESGRTTLICDLDPQGSTTFYYRVKPKIRRKAKGFLRRGKPIERSIKGTDFEGLDLLPADFSHRELDVVFAGKKRSNRQLTRVLKPLRDEYDLIVLDCPPTINVLAENILYAANHLLVPLVPTTLSIRSYEQLTDFVADCNGRVPPPSPFLTMVDRRKNLHRELVESLQDGVSDLMTTVIPYRSEIERMGIERQPLPAFAPRSDGARAYFALWEEIDRKLLK